MRNMYPIEPSGDQIPLAKELFGKYNNLINDEDVYE